MADTPNKIRGDGIGPPGDQLGPEVEMNDSYERLHGFLRQREPREVRISDIRAKYTKRKQHT